MMGLIGKSAVAAALLVIGLGASHARADVLPGNSKTDSNCYAGLDVGSAAGAILTFDKKSTTYSCIDGTACDLDGACNESCTFNAGVCVNIAGFEGCTPPGMLDKIKAKGKVKGVKGASGKVIIDASQLLDGSACGAYVDFVVPIKSTKKGDKPGKATASVNAKAPKGTKPRSNKAKYSLVCIPNENGCGSASGAFLD